MDRPNRMMRDRPILALAAGLLAGWLVGGPLIAEDAMTVEQSTLRWANGDELAGHIVGAADGKLIWHSAVLARPVSLDLAVLESVTGQKPHDAASPEDGWRFHLLTGDLIHGDIVRIDPEQVVIDSQRHGRVSIRREWIQQAARTAHRHPVDLIKAAGSGWKSLDPAWKQKGSGLADWLTDEPRAISTKVPGARLFFPTDLPEKCLIEFEVDCRFRLGFSLAVGGIEHLKQRTGDLEIETWGDELVVQTASATGEFDHLKRLALQTNSVPYRIYWDRAQGRVVIYDQAGQLIVDRSVAPAGRSASKGVLLENKGTDLTVRMLRISNWDGGPAPEVIAGQDRLRTADGGEFYGKITGPNSDGTMEVAPPDGEVREVPLHAVTEVVFSTVPLEESPAQPCQCRFHDGTNVNGELLAIDQGVATIAVPFLDLDLPVDLRGLRVCTFTPTAEGAAHETSHVLSYQGLTLHGRLAPAETELGWRPVGCDDVIPLSTDSPVRISRLEAAATPPAEESPQGTDVAYLVGGDQVPCHIEQIDERFVTLSTSLTPATKIPRSEFQAIELDVGSVAQLSSFTSPGWKAQGGKLQERTSDRIVFEQNAQISHRDLLRGGRCEFDVAWDGNSPMLLFLQLSADGRVLGNSQQMFYLIFNGDSIQIHTRSGRGVQRANVAMRRPIENPLSLRMEAAGQQVRLVLNDDVVGTLERLDPQNPMVGVTIGCQPMNPRNKPPGKPSRLTISNVSTGRGDGLFRGVMLTETGREHIVTIPRSRRHNPPGAVLVAQNGDLLRGELVAFNRSATSFRSRLEDVTIPSDRLAGIVFPPHADEDAEDAEPQRRPEGLVQVTLQSGVVLNLSSQRVLDDEIVGTHPVLGPCHISLNSIEELRTGALTGETRRRVFTEWTLIHAPEPIIPDPGGSAGFGTYSQLVGEPAKDFTLAMLEGGEFRLSDHQDKIVVLDFWASWCGPCIQALPQLTSATGAYPPDEVLFVAVNQQESEGVIRRFLETRQWNFPVALDEDGAVGGLYEVEGIPQTVIVGRGGRIEHVHLGVNPNLEAELTETLRKLLEGGGNTDSPSSDASSDE